jgi:putative phage-type endonuclease
MTEAQKDGPPTADERQGYIGGSDLAGILSLSPYSSPFKVFASKVGAELASQPDPVREEKFFWGHALEPAIARGFMKRYNIPVCRSPQPFYRHPQHQFMGAHLDFEVDHAGPCIIVECKNIENEFSPDWGDPLPLSEDSAHLVPLYYLAQCDHYMAVRDASHTYLIALFGGCKLRAYRVNRSEERERLAITAEQLFWQRVLNDDPPPFTGVDDLVDAMRAGYIEHYNGKQAKAEKVLIQLDEIGAHLCSIAARESMREKKARNARKVARNALVEHLGGKTGYLMVGKEKYGSFLTGERESFDEFSFKLAHPEIHCKYAKVNMTGPTLRLAKDYMEGEAEDEQAE